MLEGKGSAKEDRNEQTSIYIPSSPADKSLSVSSCIMSSSLDMLDTKSSSESMPVTGVGGAAEAEAAEARMTRLLGRASGVVEEDTVASAAFRFLVMGGMVSSGGEGNVDGARRLRAADDGRTGGLDWGGVGSKERTGVRARRVCDRSNAAAEIRGDLLSRWDGWWREWTVSRLCVDRTDDTRPWTGKTRGGSRQGEGRVLDCV